ncbi:KUP/HAK/KT family potassium transporter [Berryella intestinalis]|uniref:KUP/HAK/KT family potassium transporter n=1 Tax=Berryella intestinalis TaxID=1531429 RepID=UPI0009E2D8F5|nr:KUP/HAK/KT family potassium transporter [Berryella intestinalis]
MNEIETDSLIEGSPRTDKIKPRTTPSDTPHRTAGKARTARSRKPSIGLALVALGVVYGDIGTSPLYVMKAIVNGNGGIESLSQQTVIGALSLIIWTVTLITTVKYVLIALNADNKGEGGIFALYSLVRKHYPQLVGLAIVGGAALLADGILTPAVTITTAVEGLRTVEPIATFFEGGQAHVAMVAIGIIAVLFGVQKAGTSAIGSVFGIVMSCWFAFLGIAGAIQLAGCPSVLAAVNPVHAIAFLFSSDNHAGFMVLGSVFLATTGAEALYSDMGHVGRANIYASWPLVKACLILCYLGQGAWLVSNIGDPQIAAIPDMNPFFQMLDPSVRPLSVGLATAAAIIASQALITGSFTLASEATRLDLMPHLHLKYPSQEKGQVYIPRINLMLAIGCIAVVLFFRSSSAMEAAYGLAITVTMLMTTALMGVYLWKHRGRRLLSAAFVATFASLETGFFLSSLSKFPHGGYVTVLIASLLAYVMVVWQRGTSIERSQADLLPLARYKAQIGRLSQDTRLPLVADNLVYISKPGRMGKVDRDVLYSILDNRPKRARAYWLVDIVVSDDPFERSYAVESFGTDYLFRVRLNLGYKCGQFVDEYLHQIMGDLMETGELPLQQRAYSVFRRPNPTGSVRFCFLRKYATPNRTISKLDRFVISSKYAIRHVCGTPMRWYDLQGSSVDIEYVPLFGPAHRAERLCRRRIDRNPKASCGA